MHQKERKKEILNMCWKWINIQILLLFFYWPQRTLEMFPSSPVMLCAGSSLQELFYFLPRLWPSILWQDAHNVCSGKASIILIDPITTTIRVNYTSFFFYFKIYTLIYFTLLTTIVIFWILKRLLSRWLYF